MLGSDCGDISDVFCTFVVGLCVTVLCYAWLCFRETKIRSRSTNSQHGTCIVCMEEQDTCLLCPQQHHLCHDCLNKFVQGTVPASLRDSCGHIFCPSPNCGASYPFHVLEQALEPRTRIQWMEQMAQLLKLDKTSSKAIPLQGSTIRELRTALLDALGLRCPNPKCAVQHEDDPEGCTDVRCLVCGTWFCYQCFEMFRDKHETHQHAMNLHTTVYPSKLDRAQGHNQYRIRVVAALLRQIDPQMRVELLEACRAHLNEHGLPSDPMEWERLLSNDRMIMPSALASQLLLALSQPELDDKSPPPAALQLLSLPKFETNGAWSEDGWSALQLASAAGWISVVRTLLDWGARPDLVSGRQTQTALHVASGAGHEKVVRLLLKAGADPHAIEKEGGKKPAFLALKNSHFELAAMLLGRNAGDEAEKRGLLLLKHLGAINEAEVLNVLRQEGEIDLNVRGLDEHGWSPAHFAAWFNWCEILQELVKRGACIEERQAQQRTPLHLACEQGNDEIVGILLNANADLAALDVTGAKPRDRAVQKGHVACAQKIHDYLESFVDVTAEQAREQ